MSLLEWNLHIHFDEKKQRNKTELLHAVLIMTGGVLLGIWNGSRQNVFFCLPRIYRVVLFIYTAL